MPWAAASLACAEFSTERTYWRVTRREGLLKYADGQAAPPAAFGVRGRRTADGVTRLWPHVDLPDACAEPGTVRGRLSGLPRIQGDVLTVHVR